MSRLNVCVVWDGCDCLNWVGDLDHPGFSGHQGLSLEMYVLAGLLGLSLLGGVGLDSGEELVS